MLYSTIATTLHWNFKGPNSPGGTIVTDASGISGLAKIQTIINTLANVESATSVPIPMVAITLIIFNLQRFFIK